jgi:hypothetical protein
MMPNIWLFSESTYLPWNQRDRDNFLLFFLREPCMKSASYEYRKTSARKWAQLAPIGMMSANHNTYVVNQILKHWLLYLSVFWTTTSKYLFSIFKRPVCTLTKRSLSMLNWFVSIQLALFALFCFWYSNISFYLISKYTFTLHYIVDRNHVMNHLYLILMDILDYLN